MSAPLLAVHSIMSPRRAEMPCLPPLSYPSSRASLTRSCVTFIGHVVALWPFGIAARTAAAAEWSLVCLFVCFAVRLPSRSPFPSFPSSRHLTILPSIFIQRRHHFFPSLSRLLFAKLFSCSSSASSCCCCCLFVVY